MQQDGEKATAAEQGILERILLTMSMRLTKDEIEGISMEAVLTEDNIRAAIKRVKEHTAPGRDGIPIEPYTIDIDDPAIPKHLVALYRQIQERKVMTDNMRESTTTMAYKEKGEAVNVANYRPIAVTATEYRILPSHSDTRYLS